MGLKRLHRYTLLFNVSKIEKLVDEGNTLRYVVMKAYDRIQEWVRKYNMKIVPGFTETPHFILKDTVFIDPREWKPITNIIYSDPIPEYTILDTVISNLPFSLLAFNHAYLIEANYVYLYQFRDVVKEWVPKRFTVSEQLIPIYYTYKDYIQYYNARKYWYIVLSVDKLMRNDYYEREDVKAGKLYIRVIDHYPLDRLWRYFISILGDVSDISFYLANTVFVIPFTLNNIHLKPLPKIEKRIRWVLENNIPDNFILTDDKFIKIKVDVIINYSKYKDLRGYEYTTITGKVEVDNNRIMAKKDVIDRIVATIIPIIIQQYCSGDICVNPTDIVVTIMCIRKSHTAFII